MMYKATLTCFAVITATLSTFAAPRSPLQVAHDVDVIVNKALTENKVPASRQADDAEFLRRVHLDLTGRVPTLEQTVNFLKDTTSQKRTKLIDELLADEEYGEHLAIIWYHRIVKSEPEILLATRGNDLQDWLETAFNKNRPWNQIATDLLTANGSREKSPAITFFLANLDDDKVKDVAPERVTASLSKLFLGVRLECCECHNHPFNSLKQTDFWGVAAFFADTHSGNTNAKSLKAGNAEQSIYEGNKKAAKKDKDNDAPHPFGSIVIPDSKGKTVKAKFLEGATPSNLKPGTLRQTFVKWMTANDNKYFAPAMVNKMWANFFGRGLVNPIDDMVDMDSATHPEILKLLSAEFSASGYDLKHLVRCICNTNVYQRSSVALPENKEDTRLYARMPVKVMSADMLFDSLQVVLGHSVGVAAKKKDKNNKKVMGGPREEFRKFFHAEADDDTGVVDDYVHGVPQVLRLMNASQINDNTTAVNRLMKAGSADKIVEQMYLTVLSRYPTADETKKMVAFANADQGSVKAYRDLLWVLMNSGEFLLNR